MSVKYLLSLFKILNKRQDVDEESKKTAGTESVFFRISIGYNFIASLIIFLIFNASC